MLSAFFAQTFSNAFVIADYYTNTQAYAKQCQNKDKPQMHCNGKCQMVKKIQQEEKKDQDNSERKGNNKNGVVLSTKSFFASVASIYTLPDTSKKALLLSSGKSIDRSLNIFHPPQIVA